MKKIILCDLGNVLIEWNPTSLFSKLIPDINKRKDYLAKIEFEKWNAKQDAGRSWTEAEQELIQKYPDDEIYIKAYRKRYLETMGDVKIDVVNILKKLKNSHYKLYAASNWNAETFEMTRHRMPFLELFDEIHISGLIGIIKPDPNFFLSMMDKYKFKAEEAIFIDDNIENIYSAKNIGITSIHFVDANDLKIELNKIGVDIE